MFGGLQNLVVLLISVAAFVGAVWGLADAARASRDAFAAGGRQSKTTWLVILGIASALLFISLPWPVGYGSGAFGFLGLASSAAVILYFVWVKPAIDPYRNSRGSSRGNRGGW